MNEGKFKSRKQYERTKANQKYFESVIDAYREFREYSPVIAVNYDPASRSKKLVPGVINFLADVEIATKKVLTTGTLIRQWQALIDEEPLPVEVAGSIAHRCGRIYRAKGLAPYTYFRVIRKPVQRSAVAA
jgi:hypothetical protein